MALEKKDSQVEASWKFGLVATPFGQALRAMTCAHFGRDQISTQVDATPGGVLPYMGYIGMCGPKGYGFSAVLVINRVSILVDFGHFGHK